MCTRFVHNGHDMITGFNFEIDLALYTHKVIAEPDLFAIGILRPDGRWHTYHGVNRSGNAGTLLYVHENPAGAYRDDPACVTIADLTEHFLQGQLSLDDVLRLAQSRPVVYAPDATMQALLSDASGRALILEPGIGFRLEQAPFSLITNYSVLAPESTRPYLVPGDVRYEQAQSLLSSCTADFSTADALSVLQSVCQKGLWGTRVSFVYSRDQNTVFWTENNQFDQIRCHRFS